MKRAVFDIILFISIFLLPWWVCLIIGIVGLCIFPSFYEIIFLGIAIDSLYNVPTLRFKGFEFIVTLFAICLYGFVESLKRRVRFR